MYNLKNDEAMNTKHYKYIIAFVLAFMALPMVAQDCMEVHFKDGTERRYYLEGVMEVSTSKYDANGVKHSDYSYQHIKTKSRDYVFDLNEIDFISFIKYDEGKMKQDFKSAMSATMGLLSECESITDVDKVINEIKSAEGVENAWSDGHELFVKIKNWETVSFHFNHDADEDIEGAKMQINRVRSLLPQLKTVKGVNGEPLSVVVANQQHYDTNRTKIVKEYLTPLLEDFAACGFETKYVDRPTIDFFSTEIYKYDVIFLLTHGNFDPDYNTHFFATGEELGKAKKTEKEDPEEEDSDAWFDKLQDLIKETKYKGSSLIGSGWNEEKRGSTWYWVGHPCLLEDFFEDKDNGGFAEGRFKPNSVFFSTACSSLEGNDNPESWHSLADKFVNLGLGVYYGYSNHDSYGQYAGYNLLRTMLLGLTTGSAYLKLSPSHRVEPDENRSVLKRFPMDETDLIFICPTHTNKIEQEKAFTNFKSNQTVEVEGLTSSLDPQYITMGFEYSTNEDFSGYGSFTENVEVVQLTKPLEKGNVLFRANLTDLEPDQTYYYRAYTTDRRSYNYGETYSFTTKLCPANVVGVELISTEYHRNDTYPNQMYFSVSAKLTDMTDVVEWGVYFDRLSGKKEFAFDEVSPKQTANLYYSDKGQNGLMKINTSSYVASLDDELGVYVKKRNKATGELKTIYGDMFSFSLLYDKKPSMVLSNPKIVSTEVTGYRDGIPQYRSNITHDYLLTGAFWVDYVDSEVSGNNWSFSDSNPVWYPEKDGTGELSWIATYSGNTTGKAHTNWRVLHLRNGKRVYSNYVNFNGDKVLTEAWVSDTPVYRARMAGQSQSGTESMNYLSSSIPEKKYRVSNYQKKKDVPYKGGCLGTYK